MTLPKSKLQIDVPYEDLERGHHHLLSITVDSKFNHEGPNRARSPPCHSDDPTAPKETPPKRQMKYSMKPHTKSVFVVNNELPVDSVDPSHANDATFHSCDATEVHES